MKNERLLHRQRGITLIEILAALAIMAAMTAGVARLIDQYTGDVKSSITAQHLSTIGTAAQAYVKDNYGSVVSVATATVPAVVTVPMLIASGYLTTGYSATSNYGQTVCVLVLEPSANNLIALVSSEGGTAIDDLTLGGVVATLGASGGAVYSSATTTMRGAMGGWSSPATDFKANCAGGVVAQSATTGHPVMALWFSNGDLSSGFLHRDAVPGHPELNTMNTPLVMNSVQTVNAACTAGSVARDATGALLSCQGLLWKTQSSAGYWKDPVANWAALIALSGNQTGDVRQTHDTNRAFTWNGAAWIAIAVDQSGNMNVPGTLTAGNVTATGQVSVGANNRILGNGAQGSYGATTITGSKSGWTGLEFRDAAGNYQINQMTNRSNVGYHDAATGRWIEYSDMSGNKTLDQTADWNSGRLNPGWAVETWGCTTGQIAKAAYTVADGWAYNGKTLSCQSGVWKAPGGGIITGGGVAQVWKSVAGQTISCGNGQATVDTSGNHYVRANSFGWSPYSTAGYVIRDVVMATVDLNGLIVYFSQTDSGSGGALKYWMPSCTVSWN